MDKLYSYALRHFLILFARKFNFVFKIEETYFYSCKRIHHEFRSEKLTLEERIENG